MTSLWAGFQGVLDPTSEEADLIRKLSPAKMPSHIAVIMDGNGRWAGQRGLPRVEGHRMGIEAVRDTVEFAARLNLKVLTLYAFSSENWKRPKAEVSTLWDLLRNYLQKELGTLQQNRIRFDYIGRSKRLPLLVRRELESVHRATQNNKGMHLVLALSYSGREELVDAVNSLIAEGHKAPIDEGTLAARLYTAGLPDPDLLIRTSGEMRVSNFLLWQIAYSEIYVTDVLWPDFRGRDLLRAILDFQKRERRFGGILSGAFQSTP